MNFNSDHTLSHNRHMPLNEVSNLCDCMCTRMCVCAYTRAGLPFYLFLRFIWVKIHYRFLSSLQYYDFLQGKKGTSEHGQGTAYKEVHLQNNNSSTLFPSGKNYLVLSTPVSSSFSSSTLLLRIKIQALHE